MPFAARASMAGVFATFCPFAPMASKRIWSVVMKRILRPMVLLPARHPQRSNVLHYFYGSGQLAARAEEMRQAAKTRKKRLSFLSRDGTAPPVNEEYFRGSVKAGPAVPQPHQPARRPPS